MVRGPQKIFTSRPPYIKRHLLNLSRFYFFAVQNSNLNLIINTEPFFLFYTAEDEENTQYRILSRTHNIKQHQNQTKLLRMCHINCRTNHFMLSSNTQVTSPDQLHHIIPNTLKYNHSKNLCWDIKPAKESVSRLNYTSKISFLYKFLISMLTLAVDYVTDKMTSSTDMGHFKLFSLSDFKRYHHPLTPSLPNELSSECGRHTSSDISFYISTLLHKASFPHHLEVATKIYISQLLVAIPMQLISWYKSLVFTRYFPEDPGILSLLHFIITRVTSRCLTLFEENSFNRDLPGDPSFISCKLMHSNRIPTAEEEDPVLQRLRRAKRWRRSQNLELEGYLMELHQHLIIYLLSLL